VIFISLYLTASYRSCGCTLRCTVSACHMIRHHDIKRPAHLVRALLCSHCFMDSRTAASISASCRSSCASSAAVASLPAPRHDSNSASVKKNASQFKRKKTTPLRRCKKEMVKRFVDRADSSWLGLEKIKEHRTVKRSFTVRKLDSLLDMPHGRCGST
jgi:hypothetical protein